MKRTPLRRSTSLRWRSKSGKQRSKTAEWHRSREWTFGRAGNRCEARVAADCTGRAEHAHHMKLRSRGGTDDPSNLLAVCHACHGWIHANVEDATERGLIRHSWEPDE